MKRYTLDDVEYIRSRAYCTYDEAIALLDMYEGDVARVLAELERQGKLKNAGRKKDEGFGETLKRLLRSGYEHRVVVKKGERVILNLSVITVGLCLILAPHLVIIGGVLLLVLGYQFRLRNEVGMSREFDDMAYTAKENIRNAGQAFRDAPTAGASGSSAGQNSGPQPRTPAQPQPAGDDDIIIEE